MADTHTQHLRSKLATDPHHWHGHRDYPQAADTLGHALRELYEETVREELPQPLLRLLHRLDRQ